MTRRGGKEASDRSGIGDDERPLVMAPLAAWWGHSNLVKLVALRKGNHPTIFIQNRDGLLKGPHEEVEIQRKALRHGKNLAFSKDTCLEKEKVQSKVTPRKVEVGLKQRREPSRRLGWRLAWWGSTEKEA